ncbi:MAG: hypothetical protein NG740_06270 [Omnitrophica bacterium]|nr:hypothetical protein [Candidatus Omnitrophota bacterium]
MRKGLFYSLIIIGIAAVSGQIILIRELFTSFYGNELSIGFILAIWLLGCSIGSWFSGNVFADKLKKTRLLFSSLLVLLGLLMPFNIILARISRYVFGIGPGEIVGPVTFVISSSITLLPIAFLLGFLFVLGCKLMKEDLPSEAIGRAYALEAIGGAVGGAITSITLIRYFGALQIACMLSGLIFTSSYLLLYRPQKSGGKWANYLLSGITGILLIALAFSAIIGGIDFLDKKSLELKWHPLNVLESKDSIYGRTSVTEKNGQLSIFENGMFLFSSDDPQGAEEAVHFPMVLSRNPKNVLLIGGGASEIMEEILKYPVESVDYVEINPLIISFSRKFFREKPFYRLNDSRVNVENSDGRYFIKTTENLYDTVIVHLPNPYTAQINRFYTKEFFKEVKRVLKDGAILGFSVSSSENYISKEQSLFLKTLLNTAKSEFVDVKIIPGDTAYFLCSMEKGIIALDAERITDSLKNRRIDTTYVRDYYLFSKLSRERLSFLASALRGVGSVAKNMDFHPISYFYDMVLWSTYFNFKISKFFMLITKKLLMLFSLGTFLVLFGVFFMRRRGKNFKNEATLVALSTTGLSEISFEILTILAFQIIYGYLYYKIGVIIASFMFGLAFGSIYIMSRLHKITQPFRLYIKIQTLICIYPLILLLSFKAFAHLSAYPLSRQIGANLLAILPFIAGFAGGMQYPIANKLCLAKGASLGKTAGTTYAVDLLGSFAGAFLLSAFFVPIVGIPMTCVLIALLNTVSLALLLTARHRVDTV